MNERRNTFLRVLMAAISIMVVLVGIKVSLQEIKHEKKVMENLKFVDEIEGKEITFTVWQARQDKMYYVVLPSAYREQNFETKVNYDDWFYSILIDGVEYKDGDIWTDSLTEEVHSLKITDRLGQVHMEKPFQVLVSDKVPAVMVTVEDKDGIYSKVEFSNKQYLERGQIVILDTNGNFLLDETMEKFKIRGNLTSNLEKKPFTLTLANETSLLGMSESANWHLLANATDGSHIRNTIMMDWAGEISELYHPKGVSVDLFLNGEYQGLYFLTETVEISEKRLNIDSGNSMLVEMELDYRAVEEENYVVTNQEHYWVVHQEYPMEETSLEKVTGYLDDIESALYSEDGISQISNKKLEELLDFDSWTDTWLLKEISSEHDLGTTSQFGIVEDWNQQSIFLAGPEWDFDGSLGNGMVPWSRNPRNLVAAIPNTKGIESVSQNKWLAQMYLHEGFRELLIEKFQSEVQPKITSLLENEIDEYADEIRRAALMDSVRWLGNGVCRYFAYPENFEVRTGEDYHKYDVLDCHIDTIKEFLREKENFLQELWVEGAEFEVIIEEHNEEGMALDLNNDIYTWIRKDD